jgi:outer membrane protein TolC
MRGTQAAIAAGVVRAWIELAYAREQIALTRQRIAGQQSAADSLAQAVALGGLRADQHDDVLIALRTLEAELTRMQAQERNAGRRIATLTGTPAPNGIVRLPAMQPAQLLVPDFVTAPEPAELLRLRPDVAAAEQDLRKAAAGIRIAKADLYPRIDFGAGLGLTATPADLGTTGALRFGIGPSLSWGIFDMGRMRARIRAAGAEADAAAVMWESAFLNAIEETDTALDQLASARRAWQLTRDALFASDQQLSRGTARFAAGQESQVSQQFASDRLLAAKSREAEARSVAMLAWLNVQIAFGAGWKIDVAEGS